MSIKVCLFFFSTILGKIRGGIFFCLFKFFFLIKYTKNEESDKLAQIIIVVKISVFYPPSGKDWKSLPSCAKLATETIN